MLTRRTTAFTLFALASSLVLSAPASALEAANIKPFTAEKFAAAQKAGQKVLVEITAPWCPTCKAQKPIIEKLATSPAYKGLMVMQVDFDNQKDIVRSFNARSQSTLIAFKGSAETGRSVGETDPAAIEKLVKTAF